MELPVNRFKRALQAGQPQIGLWCTLSSPYATEAVAGSGFDWLLLDTEHSPGDVLTVLPQLQALAGYPAVSPVVRPACNDPVLIKRFLDIGVQTLLIPFVQNADDARAAVRAMRYPPDGIRGVSAVTRATGFGRVAQYGRRAAAELCLLVQVETREALDQIEAIAAVDGVDGIFIGPGDLAASFGLIGQLSHPDVVAAIEGAARRIRAAGKPCGILTADAAFAHASLDAGAVFVAVGVDAALLARQADALLREFRGRDGLER
jgi:4-hydroxy-2-oxoheptanedioate aldolase